MPKTSKIEQLIAEGKRQERSFLVKRDAINVDARTIEIAFSSETPVEQYWGTEILDHSPKSVRLGRLQDKGAVLMDHNPTDQVGVVDSVSLDADRVGRATVRFGKSVRANEIFQDVIDGIRSHVSVGYRIFGYTLDSHEDNNSDEDTYLITDWEPFEISFVSVPADTAVGVGRAAPAVTPAPVQTSIPPVIQSSNRSGVTVMPEPVQTTEVVDQAAIAQRSVAAERIRANEILAIGNKVGMDKEANEAVSTGTSVEEFRKLAFEQLAKKSGAVVRAAEPKPGIGMSQNEIKRFSFLRLMNALANPNDRGAQSAAGFEFETCAEAYKQSEGRDLKAGACRVPFDVLSHRDMDNFRTMPNLNVTTSTNGPELVPTNLLTASFIDLLINRMVIMSLKPTVLDGLNGNVAIPRQTGGAASYWVTEGNAPTEGQPTFDQVSLTPHTIAAWVDYTRRFFLQSSLSAEQFARKDLARSLGLGLDLACISGSGSSGQPTGILNQSGIGAVVGGTNGAAPTWAHVVALETAIAVANADVGSMAYLTNPKVRGKLKNTQIFASSATGPVWDKDGTVNGYKVGVTNQVSSTGTKGTASGVCSTIMFGNFEDLIIGMWGGLDIMVDPYSLSTSGSVRIVAMQDVDVQVRHAASFAAMTDALTT